MDDGHARSQNKPADEELFRARQDAWFDHYLKGVGPAPQSSAEVLTTKCGGALGRPVLGGRRWKELAPGEIRLDSAPAQTISPAAGDPSIGTAFDPIAGGDACATRLGRGPDRAPPTTACRRRRPAASRCSARRRSSPTSPRRRPNPGSPRACSTSRPGGTETLVARGLLRPGAGGTGFVFQLHPQAYKFEEGHVAKLELLPSDAPYSRPPNTQGPITVSNLELRLPVREQPGGIVQTPSPPVIPPGYEPAIDYREPTRTGPGGQGPAPGPRSGRPRDKGGSARRRNSSSSASSCTGPPCSGTLSAQPGQTHARDRPLLDPRRPDPEGPPPPHQSRPQVRRREEAQGARRRRPSPPSSASPTRAARRSSS